MKNKRSLQIEDKGEERDTIELETQRDLLTATLNIDGDTVNESNSPITEKQNLDQDQTVQQYDDGYYFKFTVRNIDKYGMDFYSDWLCNPEELEHVFKAFKQNEEQIQIKQWCYNILCDPADENKLYVVVDGRIVFLINTVSNTQTRSKVFEAPDKIQCLKFDSDTVKHTDGDIIYKNGIVWIPTKYKIPTQSTEVKEIVWTEAADQIRIVKYKLFLIQSEGHTLKILDKNKNKILFQCEVKGIIQSLTISNDETYLYVYDRCCNLYKMALPKTSQRIQLMTDMVDIIEFGYPTSPPPYVVAFKDNIKMIDSQTFKVISESEKSQLPTKNITKIIADKDGQFIFVLDYDENSQTSTLHYLNDKMIKVKDLRRDGEPPEMKDLRAPTQMVLVEDTLFISVFPNDEPPYMYKIKIVGGIIKKPKIQLYNKDLKKDSIIQGCAENSKPGQEIIGFQRDDKFFVRIFKKDFPIEASPRKMIAAQFNQNCQYSQFLLIMDPEKQTGELRYNNEKNMTSHIIEKYDNLKDATLIERTGNTILMRVESDQLILSKITPVDVQINFQHQLDQKPQQIYCHSDNQRIFIQYENGQVDLIELNKFKRDGEHILNQGLLLHLMKRFLDQNNDDDDRNLYFSHLPFNGQISMHENMLTVAPIKNIYQKVQALGVSQSPIFNFLLKKNIVYQMDTKGRAGLRQCERNMEQFSTQTMVEYTLTNQKYISWQDTIIMMKIRPMRNHLIQLFRRPVCSQKQINLPGQEDDVIRGSLDKKNGQRIYTSDPKISQELIDYIGLQKEDKIEKQKTFIGKMKIRQGYHTREEILMQSFKIPIIIDIMADSCMTFLDYFKNAEQSFHEQSDTNIIVKDIFYSYKYSLVLFNLPYLINSILLSIYIIWHAREVLYAMVVVSCWLIVVQFIKLSRQGYEEYFYSIFTYVELGGPISVLCFLGTSSKYAELVGAVMIFIKALQSMRIIDDYRFLTNLIGKCLIKMIPFTGLFFQVIFMFSILNYIQPYQEEGEEEGTLVDLSYPVHLTNQYRVIFGNNPDPIYYSQWVFYIIFTQFAIVLNLNLLVAIIGDAYDEVQNAQESTDLVEMCDMLIELGQFKREIMKIFCTKKKLEETIDKIQVVYMHKFSYLSELKYSQDDHWTGRVKALTTQIVNLETQIKGNREEINANTDKKINDLSQKMVNTDKKINDLSQKMVNTDKKINDLSSKMDSKMDTIVKLLEEKN